MTQGPTLQELAKLGYTDIVRAVGGRSQGAWFATYQTTPVVLKWMDDPTMLAHYDTLIPALDRLHSHGLGCAHYLGALPLNGGVLSIQKRLEGTAQDTHPETAVNDYLLLNANQYGLNAGKTDTSWGQLVVDTLIGHNTTWTDINSLLVSKSHTHHNTLRALHFHCRSIGSMCLPAMFPEQGLVHCDLHTDNMLIHNGRLAGVIDWEDSRLGDPYFDLVAYTFDLEGHGQPIWQHLSSHHHATRGLSNIITIAYVALLCAMRTVSALKTNPEDLPRQFIRAQIAMTISRHL